MSIILQQAKCPNCGGPLTGIQRTVVVCSFCEAEFERAAKTRPPFRIPTPLPPAHTVADLGIVSVGNTGYRVQGRLAQGETCDVFLARRDAPLTEMVILKVARDESRPLEQEWLITRQLRALSKGAYLDSVLPQDVAFGVARCPGKPERMASVYRWRSGFHYTFEDVRAQYPGGVDPRASVWMWNRLLDQLGCLHKIDFCHGNILPAHLLLHPRDHGLVLCGWSKWRRGRGHDIEQSAQCMTYILGSGAPRALADLIKRAPQFKDAFDLKAELKRVSGTVFGPPKFIPFVLSGGI